MRQKFNTQNEFANFFLTAINCVKSYKGDILIDAYTIMQHRFNKKNNRFIWLLRETGTILTTEQECNYYLQSCGHLKIYEIVFTNIEEMEGYFVELNNKATNSKEL